MRLLDGVVPYSIVPGNHDMLVKNRDSTLDNEFFSPARFSGRKWYGGHMGENNDNNFCSGDVLGVGLQMSVNDSGGNVLEMLTDYQGLPSGGDGWLRSLTFVPAENKIHVKTYSPLLDKHNRDAKETFSLDYDMASIKRAAG